MPNRTPRETEAVVIAAIESGQTSRSVAEAVGLSEYTVRDIKRRYGLRWKVGRPRTRPLRKKAVPTRPLTEQQQCLVVDNLKWARSVAKRRWRLTSERFAELEEYESCAMYGLVRAACRWEAKGAFRTFAGRFIDGAIINARFKDMRANGWAFENWRHVKIVRVAHRAAWPRNDDGEDIDFVPGVWCRIETGETVT